MFGPSGYSMSPSDFCTTLAARVAQVLQEHHLLLSSDAVSPASASLMGLDLLPDDDEDEDGYDDAPAIEKLFALLTRAARKAKREGPKARSVRLLGCHPQTCAALVIVGIQFTPIMPPEGELPMRVGMWAMEILGTGEAGLFEGAVNNVSELKRAFDILTHICDSARKLHGLQPPKRDPRGALYGGLGTDLGEYAGTPVPMPVPEG
jgi:hypothetical protein